MPNTPSASQKIRILSLTRHLTTTNLPNDSSPRHRIHLRPIPNNQHSQTHPLHMPLPHDPPLPPVGRKPNEPGQPPKPLPYDTWHRRFAHLGL